MTILALLLAGVACAAVGLLVDPSGVGVVLLLVGTLLVLVAAGALAADREGER